MTWVLSQIVDKPQRMEGYEIACSCGKHGLSKSELAGSHKGHVAEWVKKDA